MLATEVSFDGDELRVIARLAQNLLSCTADFGLDAGVLEDIYYKTQDFLDFGLDNNEISC